MKNEEKEDNSTERLALAIAERLYKQFYGELMTALTNSIKNFDSAIMYNDSHESKEYYKGKRDAFTEISGRLEKEYFLAGQPFRSKEESLKLLNSVEEQIRVNKNKAVDHIFPDNQYRGSRMGEAVLRNKGRVADLLEGYANEAFYCGRIYQEKQDSNDLAKLLKLYMDKGNKPMEDFNPEKFSDLCNDNFNKNIYDIR